MDTYEINTVTDLVKAVQDEKTGGYDVDFNILPNQDRARYFENYFFTIIEVDSNNPDSTIQGEYWFDADGRVNQVL